MLSPCGEMHEDKEYRSSVTAYTVSAMGEDSIDATLLIPEKKLI